jgi:hypothetical protein
MNILYNRDGSVEFQELTRQEMALLLKQIAWQMAGVMLGQQEVAAFNEAAWQDGGIGYPHLFASWLRIYRTSLEMGGAFSTFSLIEASETVVNVAIFEPYCQVWLNLHEMSLQVRPGFYWLYPQQAWLPWQYRPQLTV